MKLRLWPTNLGELFLFRRLSLNELPPALGVVLDVPVQVPELVHAGQRLDRAPARVGDEVDWKAGMIASA